MRPALSVVLLTTLIGVGQGLFIALYAGQTYAFFNNIQVNHQFYVHGAILAFGFMGAGLVASFFHLGRPERAWMSARKWRTSWLSREVIVLPVFMMFILSYGVAHYLNWTESLTYLWQFLPVDLTVILGSIGILTCLLLFLCTGMIYASVRFIPEWASPLTVINYTLMGIASGFTLSTVHALYYQGDFIAVLAISSGVLTSIALLMRLASIWRNNNLRPRIGLQQAVGIRHPQIRQNTQGFMAGSFNTKEFFHNHSLQFIKLLKPLFIVMGFLLPIVLLLLGGIFNNEELIRWAFPIQLFGLMLERWFFFVQANHVQNLYYQSVA
jgi:sulfite dehydrogenase (quinone) subunit SoeC